MPDLTKRFWEAIKSRRVSGVAPVALLLVIAVVVGLVVAVSASQRKTNTQPKASEGGFVYGGDCKREVDCRKGSKATCDRLRGCSWSDENACRADVDCSQIKSASDCSTGFGCRWVPTKINNDTVSCRCTEGELLGSNGPANCRDRVSGKEWVQAQRPGCVAKGGSGGTGGKCDNDDDCTKKNGADWYCSSNKCTKRSAVRGTPCDPSVDDPKTQEDEIGKNCRDAGLSCAPPQPDGKRYCW